MRSRLPAFAVLGLLLTACGSVAPKINPTTTTALQNTALTPYSGRQSIDPANLWPALPESTPVSDSLSEQATSTTTYTVYIYYSDPLPLDSGYRDGGALHATMLANLLGQYSNLNIVRKPISQYVAGESLGSRHNFYIGTVYGEPLPTAFVNDIAAGAPMTWMGYNAWELGSVLDQKGLSYQRLESASTPETIAATFNKINYKNYLYSKENAPQFFNLVTAGTGTQVLATAQNAAGETAPYLVKSNRFYFIADNPFQYIDPTDRYLILADSLSEMLGDTRTCQKNAVVRLEDLAPFNDPSGLRNMLDVLQEFNIPFAMTVIPDAYLNGVHYTWPENGEMLQQVYRAVNMGATVSQHGTTHNYHGLKVPEGNTSEEWEFWDKENEQPLPTLTPSTTVSRMKTGRRILLNLGLNPVTWTTPHYEADTTLYPAMKSVYSTALERRMYAADGLRGGQFFPYAVRDTYGTLVLPENLGNVQMSYPIASVLEAAEANRNLNCTVASFFVHPYLMGDNYFGADRLEKADLRNMIASIQAKGFTFVNPRKLSTRILP